MRSNILGGSNRRTCETSDLGTWVLLAICRDHKRSSTIVDMTDALACNDLLQPRLFRLDWTPRYPLAGPGCQALNVSTATQTVGRIRSLRHPVNNTLWRRGRFGFGLPSSKETKKERKNIKGDYVDCAAGAYPLIADVGDRSCMK